MTAHARVRARQRGIPEQDVSLVITYGRRCYARDALYYFFGRREARREAARLGAMVERLQGIVVVVEDGCVVTVYHNPRILKDLRQSRSRYRERSAA
nr:DUF4258 domain-containing protein [Thermalbibacter longus]